MEDLKRTIADLECELEARLEQRGTYQRLKALIGLGEPDSVETVEVALAELRTQLAAKEARTELETRCAERGPALMAQAGDLLEDIHSKWSELIPLLWKADALATEIISDFSDPALPGVSMPPFRGTSTVSHLRFFHARELAEQWRRFRVSIGKEKPIECRISRPKPGTHRRATLNEVRKLEAEGRTRAQQANLGSIQAMGR